jgi:hypothetical protein
MQLRYEWGRDNAHARSIKEWIFGRAAARPAKPAYFNSQAKRLLMANRS